MQALLALVTLILTAGSFYMYRDTNGSTMYLIATVVFLVLTLAFGAWFLAGRVNKTEDIHITE